MAFVSGCASVKFSKDPGRTHDIGFEYYPPKPYLLVKNTDKGREVSIISVPNVAEKRYVKHKPGWGSVEFGFKAQEGIITEFNAKQDSKSPETLTALSGGITAIGGVAAPAAAAGSSLLGDMLREIVPAIVAARFPPGGDVKSLLDDPLPQKSQVELKAITKIADQVDNDVIAPLSASPQPAMFATTINRLRTVSAELRKLAMIEYVSIDDLLQTVVERRNQIAPLLSVAKQELSILSESAAQAEAVGSNIVAIKAAITGLAKVVKSLESAWGPVPAPLDLYQIKKAGNELRFERVRTFE